jgi:hypothetical protein
MTYRKHARVPSLDIGDNGGFKGGENIDRDHLPAMCLEGLPHRFGATKEFQKTRHSLTEPAISIHAR